MLGAGPFTRCHSVLTRVACCDGPHNLPQTAAKFAVWITLPSLILQSFNGWVQPPAEADAQHHPTACPATRTIPNPTTAPGRCLAACHPPTSSGPSSLYPF
jgi:hypothetical protein